MKRILRSSFGQTKELKGAWGGVCGLFLGTLIVDPRNINPFKVNWLLGGTDATLYQLSFEFFRRSPVAQWPITATPQYIVGSGQVLASANALFAIPAKLISLPLATPVQFYGLQIVLTFMLLGVFSEKLLRLRLNDLVLVRVSVIYILLSPAFLYRLGLSHYELGSHFLIVWALYLLVAKNFRVRSWSILMAVASLTMVYLSVMVLALFLFGSLENLVHTRSHKSLKQISTNAARNVGLPILSFAAGLTTAGYSSWIGAATGSGVFRMNLFAFVNPNISWGTFSPLSSFISPFGSRDFVSQEVEGFGFIGIAPLLLAPFALFAAMFREKLLPLFRVSILLSTFLMFAYSLTNRIAAVRREFVYWWPNSFISLLDIFRSAPRFSWPLYYVLIFAIVYRSGFAFRSIMLRRALFFLVLAISLIDSANSVGQVRNLVVGKEPIVSAFQDPRWPQVLKGKSSIEVFPTFDLLEEAQSKQQDEFRSMWPDLALLSLKNNVGVNFGYVPRSILDYTIERNAANRIALLSGDLDPLKVYLIIDTTDPSINWSELRTHSELVFLDGFWVAFSRS